MSKVVPEQQPITGRESADPMTPMGALSALYRAFNERDMALMEASWEASDEAVMDNPLGGIRRGWEAIRGTYQRIFAGAARVQVEFFDYTLHEMGEVFWAVGRERGVLEAADGRRLQLAIRTSRLFRRDAAERWRQVHHHGSIDDPRLLEAYQQAVR